MTPISGTARKLFHELRLHPISGVEAQLDAGVRVEAGPIQVFRSSNGPLGLVIPVNGGEYRSFTPDTKSAAIKLTRVKSDGTPNLRLSLTDPGQENVFAVFVDEVLAALSESPHNPAEIAGGMLQRWRWLFSRSQIAGPMSQEQEIGLLCELEVLQTLLEKHGNSAVDRWTGPEAFPHDFELPDESIECKATVSMNGLRVGIHGITQLSPTPGKPLRLLVRRYQPDPDGDLSVPDLVSTMCRRPEVPAEAFLTKIKKLGLPPFHDDSESHFSRFRAVDSFEFLVGTDFPAINHVGPAERVQQVKYLLDLSGPETVPGYVDDKLYFTDGENQ